MALLNHLFVLQFSSCYSFVPIAQWLLLIPTQFGPLLIVSLLLPSFDLSLSSLHSALPSFLSVIQIHPFLFSPPPCRPSLHPSLRSMPPVISGSVSGSRLSPLKLSPRRPVSGRNPVLRGNYPPHVLLQHTQARRHRILLHAGLNPSALRANVVHMNIICIFLCCWMLKLVSCAAYLLC